MPPRMTVKKKYSVCVDKNDTVLFSTTDYDEFREYLYSDEYDKLDDPTWVYASLTDEEYDQMFPTIEDAT